MITVPDLGAAQRFYELLGFSQTYRYPPEGEPGFVTMERGTSSIGIGAGADTGGGSDPDAPGGAAGRFAYWVYVDDVDATVERVRASGAPVVREPVDEPWGERVAQTRDPAGNLVHLGAPIRTV